MSSISTVHYLPFLLLLLLLLVLIKAEDQKSTTPPLFPSSSPSSPFAIPPLRQVLGILRYSSHLYIFFGPAVTAQDWEPFLYVLPQSSLDYSRPSGQLLLTGSAPLRAASIWTGLSTLPIIKEHGHSAGQHLRLHQSYTYMDHTVYGDDDDDEEDEDEASDHYLLEACYYHHRKLSSASSKEEEGLAYSCVQLNLVNNCSLTAEPAALSGGGGGGASEGRRFRDAAFLGSATEETTFFVVFDALKDLKNGTNDGHYSTTITKVRAEVRPKAVQSAPCTAKAACLDRLVVVSPGTMIICELDDPVRGGGKSTTRRSGRITLTRKKECPDWSDPVSWRVSTGYVDERQFLLIDNQEGVVRYFDRSLYADDEDDKDRSFDDEEDSTSSSPPVIISGQYVEISLEEFFFGERGREDVMSTSTKLILALLLTVVVFLFAFWCLCCGREKDGMFTTAAVEGEGGGKVDEVKGDEKRVGKKKEPSGRKTGKTGSKKLTGKTKQTKKTDKSKNTATKKKKKKKQATAGSQKSKKSKKSKKKKSNEKKKSADGKEVNNNNNNSSAKKAAKQGDSKSRKKKKNNTKKSDSKKASVKTKSKSNQLSAKGIITKASDLLPAGLSKSVPSIRSEVLADGVPTAAAAAEKSVKSKKKKTSAKKGQISKKVSPAAAGKKTSKKSKKTTPVGGGGKTAKKSSKKSKPMGKGKGMTTTTGKGKTGGKVGGGGGIIPGPPKTGAVQQQPPVKKAKLPKSLFKTGAAVQNSAQNKDSDVSAAGKERGPSD